MALYLVKVTDTINNYELLNVGYSEAENLTATINTKFNKLKKGCKWDYILHLESNECKKFKSQVIQEIKKADILRHSPLGDPIGEAKKQSTSEYFFAKDIGKIYTAMATIYNNNKQLFMLKYVMTRNEIKNIKDQAELKERIRNLEHKLYTDEKPPYL